MEIRRFVLIGESSLQLIQTVLKLFITMLETRLLIDIALVASVST